MNRIPCLVLVSIVLWSATQVSADSSDTHWLNPEFQRDAKGDPAAIDRIEMDLVRFFGGEILEWGNNRFAMPLRQEQYVFGTQRSLLVNVLAIEWQHSMNAVNLLTLSARYGDSLSSDSESLSGASGTTAILSWDSLFGSESSLTGKLYVGDEEAKLRANGDRRYFGMHVEGRYSLWHDHTPFASLRWQRTLYDALDHGGAFGPPLRHENFSRFAAGWNWQVGPGWDLRAEANYRLSDENIDIPDLDRTQFYFSTHYGFR